MSSITINGQPYDLDSALAAAELNHLLYLKQNTGLGLKTIMSKLQSLEGAADAGDGDRAEQVAAVMAAFEDEETLNAFRGIVWLVRTKHGDRGDDGRYLSIDAASEGVSIADFAGAGDEDESGAEPAAESEASPADPTSPVDGQEPAATS